MGMSSRQYKVKKEKIEKQNFSIEDFTWRFNHFVSNPKELKMTGFVGKIHGNMFWVKYYPEHVTIKNLFELYSPTIMQGKICRSANGICIEYYYDKDELVYALSYGAIGFILFMIYKLIKIGLGLDYSMIQSLIVSVICLIPFVTIPVLGIWLYMKPSKASQNKLKKALLEDMLGIYNSGEKASDEKSNT